MDSGGKKGNAISRLNSLSSTLFRGKRSSSGRSSINSQGEEKAYNMQASLEAKKCDSESR